MQFRGMTNTWFDGWCMSFHTLPLKKKYAIVKCINGIPNRKNLQELMNAVNTLQAEHCLFRDPLLEHIAKVLDRKFHSEFRLHFSKTKNTWDATACKELLSMLQQAIEHNEFAIRRIKLCD